MAKKSFDWKSIPNLIVRNGHCHARVEMAGKSHWRSLHIEADLDGRNADDVREALRAFKLELAKNTFAILKLTKSVDDHSTFEDVFAAYRKICAGRDIAAKTTERNIDYMRFIIRTVHGNSFNVDKARASLCTEDLLRSYKSERITEFKAEAEENEFSQETYEQKFKSRMTTIKSSIQQARSLFAVQITQEAPYRALHLPDLTAFMKFRSGGSTTRTWEEPDISVIVALREGAALFKQTTPKLWLALALTANFGMRRGSAVAARWDWFTEKADGSAIVRVRRAKGSHSFVGVSPATWTEFKRIRDTKDATMTGTEFILPGQTMEERDDILETLKNWLRAIGFDESRCPVHEMRGLFANKMKSEHSLSDAQGALGHAAMKTMIASYIGHGTEKSVDVVG